MSERAAEAFWGDTDATTALQRYQTLVNLVDDAIYRLDPDGRFVAVNDSIVEITGYTRDTLLGEHVSLVFDEDDCQRIEREISRRLATDGRHRNEPIELIAHTADGGIVPCELQLDLLCDDGEFQGTVGIVRDSNEHTRTEDSSEHRGVEQERRESEAKFRRLLEHLDEVVWMTTADMREILYVNSAFETVYGRDREQLYENPEVLLEAVHPDDQERIREELDQEVDDTYSIEYRIVQPDGDVRWLHDRIIPIHDTDGNVYRIVGEVMDITERKKWERQLEESERRYRTLAESFPNGLVTLFDRDFEYTLAAGKGFDRIPVEPDDLEGRQFHEVWPDQTVAELEPAFQAVFEGEEQSVELTYADREWVLYAVPITDEHGTVFAGMTMAQDITKQKERERYLEDAKSQLEAATEAGAVGTWEWDIRADEMIVGPSFARTFGVDPEVARDGVSLDRFISAIHEDDRDRIEAKIEEAVESCGEYEAEYRVWNADDEIRWVVARGRVECDDDGTPVKFPGALTDITGRKRAELRLERTTEQLETLFEILPVGVLVADETGRLVEANETAKEIWGGDVFDANSIDEYEQYAAVWANSGEPVEPEEWTLARVLEGEEVTDPDIFEIEAADGERRIIRVEGMPVRDAGGDVTRGVVTMTDITERREHQRKIEESNERLEQFAYAASHDLQEPLRMVTSYLQLLEDRYGDAFDEEGREFLEFAVDGADRMREMIHGLLAYSRVETQGDPFEPINLNAVLEDVLEDLQIQIEESDAEVTTEELPCVEGDVNQVRQVFQNLLSNAITYSGDEPPRIHVDANRRGREWVISVEDDGIGIDPEDQDRIFTVFDRLHSREEYEGTGIGLALCERIIDRHGGEIWVTSEPGEGATFSFTLPVSRDQ